MASRWIIVAITFVSIYFSAATDTTDLILIENDHSVDFFCPANNSAARVMFIWYLTTKNATLGHCDRSTCSSVNAGTAIVKDANGFYINVQIQTVQDTRTIKRFSCAYTSDSNENIVVSVKVYNIFIIAKPTNASCDQPRISEDNNFILLTCRTTKVFPPADCVPYFTNKTKIVFGTTTYIHTEISISPLYYDTKCTWMSPISNFEAGSYSFYVSLLPNVTSDAMYGYNVTLHDNLNLTIPRVELSTECFAGTNVFNGYIKPRATINCLCNLEEKGNPPSSVVWLDSGGLNIGTRINSTAEVLNIYPSHDSTQFICTGVSGLKNGNTSIVYNVTYAKGPSACKLTLDSTEWNLCNNKSITVNVTCEVERSTVIPGFNSIYSVNGSTVSGLSDKTHISTVIKTAGNSLIRCDVHNSKFSDVSTFCEQLVLIRAPPLLHPTLTIADKLGSESSVQEFENYEIKCNVFGGVPSVSSVTVSCGNIIGSTQSGNNLKSSVAFTRNMTGQNCTCTAQHITGCYENNTSQTKLNVAFPSSVTRFIIQNGTSILENGTLAELDCQAEGNPSPIMSVSLRNITLFRNYTTDFVHFNKLMLCEDAGNYICKADNGLNNIGLPINQTQTITVFVKCPLQLYNSKTISTNFSTSLGKTFSTNFSIYGYPEPSSIFIYKVDVKSYVDMKLIDTSLNQDTNSKHKTAVRILPMEPPYINLEVTIFDIKDEDFTKYTLVVSQSGFQNFTHIYYIEEAVSEPSEQNYEINVGAAVGGSIGAVAFVILVVAVVYVIRNYDISCKKKKGNIDKDSNNYSELSVSQRQRDIHKYETPNIVSEVSTVSNPKTNYINVSENLKEDHPYEKIDNL